MRKFIINKLGHGHVGKDNANAQRKDILHDVEQHSQSQSAYQERQRYSLCYNLFEKNLSKLHQAAWTGDHAKVAQLAKKNPCLLDKHKRTPLHIACAHGNAAVVAELLKLKVKINIGDGAACTPLTKAVENKQVHCAELMLEAKADANAKDISGEVCLHYAVRADYLQMVEALLQTDRIDINITNKFGQTPLHIGATYGCVSASRVLLQASALVNVQDVDGCTPLMNACQEGDIAMVTLLLEYNADTQIKDGKGHLAEDIAVLFGKDQNADCYNAITGVNPQYAGNERREVVDQCTYLPTSDRSDLLDVSECDYSMSQGSAAADTWNDTDTEIETHSQSMPAVSFMRFLNESSGSANPICDISDEIYEDSDVSCQELTVGGQQSTFVSPRRRMQARQLYNPGGSGDAEGKLIGSNAAEADNSDRSSKWDALTDDKTDTQADYSMATPMGESAMPEYQNSASIEDVFMTYIPKPVVCEQQVVTTDQIEIITKDNTHKDDMDENETKPPIAVSFGEKLPGPQHSSTSVNQTVPSCTEDVPQPLAVPSKDCVQDVTSSEESLLCALENEAKFVELTDQQMEMIDELCVTSNDNMMCDKRGSEGTKADVTGVGEEVKSAEYDVEVLSSTEAQAIRMEIESQPETQYVRSESPKEAVDLQECVDPLDGQCTPTSAVLSCISEVDILDASLTSDSVSDNDMLETASVDLEANKTLQAANCEWQEQQLMAEHLHEMEKTQQKQQSEMRGLEEDMKEDLQDEYEQTSFQLSLNDSAQHVNSYQQDDRKTTSEVEKDTYSDDDSHRLQTQRMLAEMEWNDIKQCKMVKRQLSHILDRSDSLSCRNMSANNCQQDMDNTEPSSSAERVDMSSELLHGMIEPAGDVSISYSDISGHRGVSHVAQPASMTATNVNFSANPSDCANVMLLQQQMLKLEEQLSEEHRKCTQLERRLKEYSNERIELMQKLLDAKKTISALEQTKIELETKTKSLLYSLNEHQERSRSEEILHTKITEMLAKKEEGFAHEIKAKQRAEVALCSLQIELRSAQSSNKQLESEREELTRQLQTEKKNCDLQQQIHTDLLQKRTKAAESNAGSVGALQQELAETIEQLEMSDDKKSAELYAVKMELDRTKTQGEICQAMLASENADLLNKVQQLKTDIKLNEDALDYASLHYQKEICRLETTNTKLNADLEAKSQLQKDLVDLESKLNCTCAELQQVFNEKNESERTQLQYQLDAQRMLDGQQEELSQFKQNIQKITEEALNCGKQLESVKAENSKLTAEIQCGGSCKEKLQNELVAMECKLTCKDSELEKVSMEKKQLESALQKCHEEMQQSMHAHEKQLASLMHDIQKITSETNETVQAANMRLSEEIEKGATCRNKLQIDLEQATTEKRELERTLQKCRDDYHRTMDLQQNELFSMRQDLQKMNQDMKEKEGLQTENCKLKAQLEQDVCNRDRIDRELKQAISEKNEQERCHVKYQQDSQMTIDLLEQKLAHLKQHVQQITQDSLENETHIETVKKENTKLRYDHEQETTIRDKIQNQVATLESQLQSTKTELQQVIAAKTELERNQETCESENHHRLQLQERELTQLKQDVQKMKSEALANERDMESLKKDKQNLTAELMHESLCKEELQNNVASFDGKLNSAMSKLTEMKKEKNELEKNQEDHHQARDQEISQLQQDIRRLTQETARYAKESDNLHTVNDSLNAEITRENQVKEKLKKYVTSLKTKLNTTNTELQQALKDKNLLKSGHQLEGWQPSEFTEQENYRCRLLEAESRICKMKTEIAQLEQDKQEVTKQHEETKSRLCAILMGKDTVDKIVQQLKCENQKLKDQVEVLKSEGKEDRLEFERRIKCEQEEKSRVYLNTKLSDVNSFLDQQSRVREQLDAQRDSNDMEQQKKFEQAQQTSQEEMNKLRASLRECEAQQRCKEAELAHYKNLFESEHKMRRSMAGRDSQSSGQSAHGNKLERYQLSQSGLSGVTAEKPFPGCSSSNLNGMPWPPRGSSQHTVESFVMQQLDRSITDQLDKGIQLRTSLPPAYTSTVNVRPPPLSKSRHEELQRKYLY